MADYFYFCMRCNRTVLSEERMIMHNRDFHSKSVRLCVRCINTFQTTDAKKYHICPLPKPHRNVKVMKDYLEQAKKGMKGYLEMVEHLMNQSNTVAIVGLPLAENIKSGWRTVEVASSFDQKGMLAGGGFILRESNAAKTPILVEAFPLQGESALFAEVCALLEAMERSTAFAGLKNKKGGVVFLFESAELATCFTEPIFPEDYAGPIINECKCKLRVREAEFKVMQVQGEKIAAAKWLAEHGMTSQQHTELGNGKGPWPPWPPGLAELLARPPLY